MSSMSIFMNCNGILFVLLLLLTGCQKEIPEEFARSRIREAAANPQSQNIIKSWSLSINSIPFENQPKLILDEKIPMTGHVEVNPGTVPQKLLMQLTITLRPVGEATHDDWTSESVRDINLEFSAFLPPSGEIESSTLLRSRHFECGEYDARLYFHTMDTMRGTAKFELLSTSKITIANP